MATITIYPDIVVGTGTSRIAYEGTVTKASSQYPFDRGDTVVVKVMQSDMYNKGYRLSQTDFRAQGKADELSKVFTDRKVISKEGRTVAVLFQSTYLWVFTKNHYNSSGTKVIVDGESGLVERKMGGAFKKFNSNSGWSSGNKRADFFSHWSYWYTNGTELVCDLQGIESKGECKLTFGARSYMNYLFLTDPAIISVDRRWGITDLGKAGIKNWFAMHTCNHLCLGYGLQNYVPKKRFVTRQVYRATAYCANTPRLQKRKGSCSIQ